MNPSVHPKRVHHPTEEFDGVNQSASSDLFDSIQLQNFLELDQDLIIILDGGTTPSDSPTTMHIAFCNTSMRQSEFCGGLLMSLEGRPTHAPEHGLGSALGAWISSAVHTLQAGSTGSCILHGMLWTIQNYGKCGVLVRGTKMPYGACVEPKLTSLMLSKPLDEPLALETLSMRDSQDLDQDGLPSRSPRKARKGAHSRDISSGLQPSQVDWVAFPAELPRSFLAEPLSQHQMFVRDFDWSSTELGPMHKWPSQLRQTVDMVLVNPGPAAVLWGKGLNMIYNEAYLDIAGVKHPDLMGKGPAKPFAEVWEQYFAQPLLESTVTKKAFAEERLCLLLERLGFPEETYMTFAFLPLLNDQNNVAAFYHPVFEMTKEVLAERRMTMLLKTSERTAGADDLATFWKLVLSSLEENELDVPFAALYSITDAEEAPDEDTCHSRDSASSGSCSIMNRCILEGSIGFPKAHDALSDNLDLDDSIKGFAPAFRTVMKTRRPLLLQTKDGTLAENLIHGLIKRGYNDICNTVVVCPLQATTTDKTSGLLVLGLASTRPYDEDYRIFIDLLIRQLRSSLASVVLFEDEKKRGRSAAEEALYQQNQLLMRLQERSRENEIIETRYKLLAERAPVGIYDFDIHGGIKFANQVWYDITGHDPANTAAMSWTDSIFEEDLAGVLANWNRIVEERKPSRVECRFRKSWRPSYNNDADLELPYTWTLASAFPVLDNDGNLEGVTGTITDITQQKRLTELQTQRIDDMIEQKRQQENFYDMTSHELRNPLNAMLQCAEDLDQSLEHLHSSNSTASASIPSIEDCIDSAKTILYCGKHQQHIINDILTLSKLDARLLGINPLNVRPVEIAANAINLFDSEARASDVQLDLQVSDSYRELRIQDVFMDPSRVVQILVNFIANGIKFTKDRPIRQMRVSLSASIEKPSSITSNVKLIPSGRPLQDPTTKMEWGDGEIIYLYFSVDDSGSGLTQAEMSILFGRFSQNSPKTHAHYGGSGLGLFISQHLAELQGGEVGLASEVGVGSSFVFYIKARRAQTPPEALEVPIPSPKILGTALPSQNHRPRTTTPLSTTRSTGPTTTATAANIRPLHILIVEDNLINQKVLKKQLQKLNHTISIANNGLEALALVQRSTYWIPPPPSPTALDIVLMDIEMPEMDGRACVAQIRAWEAAGQIRGRVPVIAVTANVRSGGKSAVGFGFDESVSKPYAIPELVRVMGRVVGGGGGKGYDA